MMRFFIDGVFKEEGLFVDGCNVIGLKGHFGRNDCKREEEI
jgi:hypothetical protein